MMRKLIVMLLVLLVAAVPACGSPYVMKLGYQDPPDLFLANEHPASFVFKSIVEAKTDGGITVELYPSGILGKEVEQLENCQLGIIQSTIVCSGPMATFVPEYNLTALPFLFPNNIVAWKVLDGWFGKELADTILKKTGLRVLGIMEDGGFTAVTNSVREVRTPQDMKGLKMRTEEHPAHIEFTKAVGAGAVPIAWAEVYTSLQTGVADGQYNALPIIVLGKLYEVQKYVTRLEHIYNTDVWVINNEWFTSLPKDYQRIIIEAAEVANAVGRGVTSIANATGADLLISEGIQVYTPSPEERDAFRDIAQPKVIEWLQKLIGPEWVDKALRAVEEASAELEAIAE